MRLQFSVEVFVTQESGRKIITKNRSASAFLNLLQHLHTRLNSVHGYRSEIFTFENLNLFIFNTIFVEISAWTTQHRKRSVRMISSLRATCDDEQPSNTNTSLSDLLFLQAVGCTKRNELNK